MGKFQKAREGRDDMGQQREEVIPLFAAFGTRLILSLDRYDGDWENEKMHGQGTMTWANGDKYRAVSSRT